MSIGLPSKLTAVRDSLYSPISCDFVETRISSAALISMRIMVILSVLMKEERSIAEISCRRLMTSVLLNAVGIRRSVSG